MTSTPSQSQPEADHPQVEHADVTDTDPDSPYLGYRHSKRGRPISWVSVAIMIAAFATGGVALALWNWPLFWICVGVFLAGGVLGLAGGIMRDVH